MAIMTSTEASTMVAVIIGGGLGNAIWGWAEDNSYIGPHRGKMLAAGLLAYSLLVLASTNQKINALKNRLMR